MLGSSFSQIAAGALAFSAALAGAANAQQPQCFPTEALYAALHEQFREEPVGLGLEARGSAVIVFASRDGASWTLVVSLPHGQSCIVADGTGWNTLPLAAGPDRGS